jgi:hypothetical protein
MTQEEIQEYNQKCADFLGFKYKNQSKFWATYPLDNNSYLAKFGYMQVETFKFHSDWNWIMEVVEKIESLKYLIDITDNEVYVNSNLIKQKNVTDGGTMNSHNEKYYPVIVEITDERLSKKEAVVKAINQFLIWYNENNKK